MKKYKIVEVEWIDAQSSLEPMTISDLEKQPIITTYSSGYLIKQDKEKVVLAFMMFGEDKSGELIMKHYQIIPEKMVKKIKILK